jgi:hypothetical protein
MRMGKKLRIATILMSMIMAATTLIFATFAITQNSSDVEYGGVVRITGNADIDVEIKFIEAESRSVIFEIIADENGIIEKKNGEVVKSVTNNVADLTAYDIFTKPELTLGENYIFEVTIRNRNASGGGSGYALAKIGDISVDPAEGLSEYYNVVNPDISDDELEPGEAKSFEIYVNTKSGAILRNGDVDVSYALNIVANKVTA